MTNLGSVLKSKDITLPAKVHIVKAMRVELYGRLSAEKLMLQNCCAREDS